MVVINETGFAEKIEEYLKSPEKFNQEAVVDTLDPIDQQSKWNKRKGITFGHNTKLVMQLLARSYSSLPKETDQSYFSQEVAKAVQHFAHPFPNQDNLCYPHFLFHGLVKPSLEDVVDKLRNNSRIIHETLKEKEKIITRHKTEKVTENLQLLMSNGLTDDYFGIAYLLVKQDSPLVSSASGYVAKASFFIDRTENEIYVITLQGRRYESLGDHSKKEERVKEGEREYSKIGNILGMSPRRFILTKLMEYGRENGFTRIKVIGPEEHPMAIENHNGFFGSYEAVVRKAGINKEVECYLKAEL